MRNKNLTSRQQEVLDFVQSATERDGHPPTIRDIAAHFGIRVHAVSCHLRLLREKEAITWVPGAARTLRVLVKNPAPETAKAG